MYSRFWAFSSVGRAPRLHRGCHRFEPGRAHKKVARAEVDKTSARVLSFNGPKQLHSAGAPVVD